jgi:predicted transcriptional regulator
MAAPSTPAAQALLDALADRPGATALELAQAAGIGRSTAAKLLATLASQGRVLRQPGGRRGGRPAADRWTLPSPDPTPTSGPPTATPTPIAEPSATGSGRLGAGQLRQLVLGCLAERPGQALSPTAIAKTLDRSAGAVANALRVLASHGAVTQTQPKPRRYIITTAGGDQTDARH